MIDWDAEVLGPVMAVFGEEVEYRSQEGITVIIPDAVFDEAYHGIASIGDAVDANTASPVLGVRDARLPVPYQQGDTLTIKRTGERYVVNDAQPDGHGHTLLFLNFYQE